MSNRYSKYIPLGYEPVQPPLDVLAEVIKTKRQQNDSIEKALDDLGNVRINAIKDSFMEPRAHEIMKAWQNEKDSIVQEAVGQNNGDFTSVRRRVQKLKNDITSQVLNGEAGAIDSAYKDFQAKYQEYSKDFKDDPIRLSDQVNMYKYTLKTPQKFNKDLGRYENVGSLTPPMSAVQADEIAKKEAAAIPMQKVKSGYTTHEGLYDVQHTTESEFKDPTRIAAATRSALQTNPHYTQAALWEGTNEAFKQFGYAPGSPESQAYAQMYYQGKLERDSHSADNLGQFNVVEVKDENGNKAYKYVPVSGTVREAKANAFKLKGTPNFSDLAAARAQDAAIQPTERIDPLTVGITGTDKIVGRADLKIVNNLFKEAGYGGSSIFGAGRSAGAAAIGASSSPAKEIFKPEVYNKNFDLLVKAVQQSAPDVPVDKPALKRFVDQAVANNVNMGSAVKAYNDYKDTAFKNLGGETPYSPTIFAIDDPKERMETTVSTLANPSLGVWLTKDGKVIKTDSEYNTGMLKEQYGDLITGKAGGKGVVDDNSLYGKITGYSDPLPWNKKPTKVMHLSNGITAYIDDDIASNSPDVNQTNNAINEYHTGMITGTSNKFYPPPMSANSGLGQEINSQLGVPAISGIGTKKVAVTGKFTEGGKTYPILSVYDDNDAFLGQVKSKQLSTHLKQYSSKKFQYDTGKRITKKDMKGNVITFEHRDEN